MKPFSYLLIISLVFIYLIIKNYDKLKYKVISRISLSLFVVVFIFVSIAPMKLTFIANKLGIGRGADLLGYLTTLGLLTTIGIFYTKIAMMERTIGRLNREIAIKELSDNLENK